MPENLQSLPAESAEPVVVESDDLGAELEAGYDKLVAGGTEPAEVTEQGESSPAADRARDQQGRYTKAEQAAQAAAAATPATEFKIPEKWPADVRAELEAMHKVHPAHAEFVLKQYAFLRGEAARWQQYQSKNIEKLSTVQKQVDDLLAPGRQQRALKGIDDTGYIRNLVAAGDFLDKNPIEGIKFLAKQYGVDLSNLDAQGAGEPAIAPELQRVMQENAQIKAMLLQGHQQQTQQQTEQQLSRAGDWINQFASQQDPQGQPLYPYFDEVLPEIITIVQHQIGNGLQVDVNAAYKTAIRMNDSVWLKEQARSRPQEEAQRKREIEEARRAGLSVSGSGAASSEGVPDDLGAHLERNYDKFVRS